MDFEIGSLWTDSIAKYKVVARYPGYVITENQSTGDRRVHSLGDFLDNMKMVNNNHDEILIAIESITVLLDKILEHLESGK